MAYNENYILPYVLCVMHVQAIMSLFNSSLNWQSNTRSSLPLLSTEDQFSYQSYLTEFVLLFNPQLREINSFICLLRVLRLSESKTNRLEFERCSLISYSEPFSITPPAQHRHSQVVTGVRTDQVIGRDPVF